MTTGRQYRVKATLGKGAFGDVFLAETVGTGIARTVAIKVLHSDRAQVPGLLARLRDEARMLAMLKHRAIVAVDDLVELDGAWSIVMEYVEGADVAELVEQGPIPPVAALQIAEEVCYALHAAWTTPAPDGTPLRLIHRDVKPSNLRVTPHGDVKLLDFGVARADFGDREGATVDAALGTIAYMAPERFAGDDLPAGDVYALGVTLFEMLTGIKPGKTAGDVDRAPPGRGCAAQWTWLKQASPALHELIAKMLARSPEDRPSARDCARRLASIRAGIEGESLSEWAEKVVPPVVSGGLASRADQRSGSVLIERTGSLNLPTQEGGSRVGLVVAGGAFGAFGLVGVVVLGVLIGVGAWYWAEGRADAAPETVVVKTAEPARPAPVPEPAKAEATMVAPAEAAPVEGTAAAPAKGEAAPTPAPTTAEPTKGEPTTAVPAKVDAKKDPKAQPPKVEATNVDAPKTEAPKTEPPKTEPPKTEPPKTESTATTGTLVVAGDATSVVFRGAGGTSRGGAAQPGTWTADVSFGEKQVTVRDIQVLAGKTTTIKCSSGFLTCRVIGP